MRDANIPKAGERSPGASNMMTLLQFRQEEIGDLTGYIKKAIMAIINWIIKKKETDQGESK